MKTPPTESLPTKKPPMKTIPRMTLEERLTSQIDFAEAVGERLAQMGRMPIRKTKGPGPNPMYCFTLGKGSEIDTFVPEL